MKIIKNEKHLEHIKRIGKISNTIRYSRITEILLVIIFMISFSIACHWQYFDQFFGADSSMLYTGYMDNDSTSQLLSGVSFLESSIQKGDLGWSFSNGLGGDVFSEFSYYYSTSPIFYLQFLVKMIFGDLGQNIFIAQQWKLIFSIVKQFMAMFFMYSLLRQEKKAKYSSLIAGIVYGSVRWFFSEGVLFDFMTDSLIWVPLVVMAYNIYVEKNKIVPLIAVLALTVANSFYFGCMSCIFFATFFIVMSIKEKYSFKEHIKDVFKLALLSITAVLMSAVAFLPSINGFMSAGRAQSEIESVILPRDAFFSTLTQYFTTNNAIIFFPAFLLLMFTLNFKKMSFKSKKKFVLAGFWLIVNMIPVFSRLMNGMSYETERWYYLVVFAVAYAIPDLIEEWRDQKNSKFKSCVLLSLYLICTIYPKRKDNELGVNCTIFSIIAIMLLYIINSNKDKIKIKLGKILKSRVVQTTAKSGIVICIALIYAWGATDYAKNSPSNKIRSLDEGTTSSFIVGNKSQRNMNAELTPSTTEFYRVDDGQVYNTVSRYENRSWLNGNYTVSAYNSLIASNLHEWLKNTYNISMRYNTPSFYRGFDQRLFLETAWGVGYKINYKDPPYGYKRINLECGETALKNNISTGFDMWYDTSISQEEYDSLDYAEKDAALLQTAVLENEKGEYPDADLDDVTEITKINFSEAEYINCEKKAGKIIAKEEAEIIIPINLKSEHEGEYLLSFELKEQSDARFTITVNGDTFKSFETSYQWHYDLDEFSFKIDGSADKITIKLSKGTYKFRKTRLAFNSYEKFENWVEQRNRYNLENYVIDGSNISGEITNETAGILALSMPYNKGWKCYVDGKKTDLVLVNGIFTGIELEPGEHKIEMKFTSPYVVLGGCITLATILGLAVFLWWKRSGKSFKRSNKEVVEKEEIEQQ